MRHLRRSSICIQYSEGRASPRLTLSPRGEAMGKRAEPPRSSIGLGGFWHSKEFIRESPPVFL